MLRIKRNFRWFSLVLTTLAFLATKPADAELFPELTLPFPDTAFVSTFDFAAGGRLIAFDGFTVYRQESLLSTNLIPIGTLPPEFRGTVDPSFAIVSPTGLFVILGAGGGGFEFGNPAFNGNIFKMSIFGGEAELIAQFPFNTEATFRGPGQLVFSQGETFGPLTGSVELLNLFTDNNVRLVANIPGAPGGVVFDKSGNLYAGLGFGQDTMRTGEIRRFDAAQVKQTISTGVPLDFDSDGTLIVQILSASNLHFDLQGHLFVGGGDLIGPTGSFGFFAEVDVDTGTVINKFDPTDGDPDDQDIVFYFLSFTPVGCRLGAVDEFAFFGSGTPTVFEMSTCIP